MNKTDLASLKLHKKKGGKIETKSKVYLKNKKDLSLAYTPGVGAVSSLLANNNDLAKDYTLKGNSVAVISDGSAVLGLGNLGAIGAIPVMEGKAILFKKFAGIDAFPICLDTQDTEEIIKTVKYIAPVFGAVNLEDISAPRCFEIEERLKKELNIPVFHDDQHGTALVVLSGLINSLKIKKLKKEKAVVVINGAGAAGTAIAKILIKYGFRHVTVLDSVGIISSERKDLNEAKKELASITNPWLSRGDLSSALVGSDIFIGVSKGNVLKKEAIKSMNEKPVIFALANPVPEINPLDAKKSGAFIVATGRSDFPNQVNNILAFPGVIRGALDSGVRQIDDKMLIKAAENLALSIKHPNPDKILPDPFDRKVVKLVAKAIK